MAHTVNIDSGDIREPAFAAFCDTEGCLWRGEWQHTDTFPEDDDDDMAQMDAAYAAAEADAEAHRQDTSRIDLEAAGRGVFRWAPSDRAPIVGTP